MLRFAAGEPELPTVPAKGPDQGTFSQWRNCSPQLLKAAESSYKEGFPAAPCVWTDSCEAAQPCCTVRALGWAGDPAQARDGPSAQGWGPLLSSGSPVPSGSTRA